ncbi:MAG TPA: hypothetical protein VLX92_07705 [Kofleriaceae bacterium]|nr:hypothetical protein [Kofleriaceae bacterium]
MTAEDFIAHVAGHAGAALGEAEVATHVVLSNLGGYLARGRRDQVAAELPPTFRNALLSPADIAIPIEERLFALDHDVARARELLASVCHVLAEQLSDEALAWLAGALPAQLARLLERPAHELHFDEHVGGVEHTLASGKPGSYHAIGDQAADRSQSESVAAGNPHGATKLSSSSGTTQERRHDTLSEAHGEAHRAIGTAKR